MATTADHYVGRAGTLTWLGHATVLLATTSGTRVVFDPWLEGNPKCPADLTDIGPLDVIAVTHGHFDHIGSVVPLAASTGATVLCVPELAAYFASVGVANILEMNKGGTITVKDVRFTMVNADHSCGVSVGDGQVNVYGGNPVGFIVRVPDGEGGPIYVSGDTNVFGDMALIRDLYAPEIGLMPIDGYYNMGPYEAAHAVALLGLRRFVPIHYGTFPILTGSPDEVITQLKSRGVATNTMVLEPGDAIDLLS
jgi:L-ascorbate metabolism protein UlaG (beta-lactamase superfamily)